MDEIDIDVLAAAGITELELAVICGELPASVLIALGDGVTSAGETTQQLRRVDDSIWRELGL